MRYLLTFVIIIFFSTISFCQQFKDSVEIKGKVYPLSYDTTYLARRNFQRVMNRIFGQVAVGAETGTDLANYVSLEPVNGSFALNGYGQFNKNDTTAPLFYSLQLKGGLVGSNSVELFSNSKLNSSFSGQLKFHYMLKKKWLTYLDNAEVRLNEQRDSTLQKYIQELIKLRNEVAQNDHMITFNENQLKLLKHKLNKQQKLLKDAKDSVSKYINVPDILTLYNDSTDKLSTSIGQLYMDSLNLEYRIKGLKAKKRMIDSVGATSGESIYVRNNTTDIRETLRRQIDTVELKAQISSVNIWWLSFSLGYNRQKYYRYYDTLEFTKQISDTTFDVPEFTISGNFYHQGFLSGNIWYVNFGLTRTKTNNVSSLTPIDVTDEKEIPNPPTKRKTSRKYSAYTEPIIEHKSWIPFANVYYMFGRRDKSAFHLFPELVFREDKKNLFNAGFGYVFSFKDKKDKKTIINTEAFVKFMDIGDAEKTGQPFHRRNSIGINIGLPFNFIL